MHGSSLAVGIADKRKLGAATSAPSTASSGPFGFCSPSRASARPQRRLAKLPIRRSRRSIWTLFTLDFAQLDRLFGASPTVVANQHLAVDETAVLTAPLRLNGGTFSVGAITQANLANLTWDAGALNITAQDAVVGAAGQLGASHSSLLFFVAFLVCAFAPWREILFQASIP